MKKKPLLISLCAVAVLAAGAYGYGVYQFQKVFLPNTFINGVDVSRKTPEAVQEQLENEDGEFTVKLKDGKSESFKLKDIDFCRKTDVEVSDLFKKQSAWKWPMAIFKKTSYDVGLEAQYDSTKLKEVVKSLKAVSGDDVQAPVDAYLSRTDTGYEIVPEDNGNTIKKKKAIKKIEKALDEFTYEVDLEKEKCYKTASVTSDDENLNAQLANINKILDTVVTMDLSCGASETIDSSVFFPWIAYDAASNSVTIDNTAVAEYVDTLAEKYDTYQDKRNFHTTGGADIQVGGNELDSYGFWMDQKQTEEVIKAAVMSGESQGVVPAWKLPTAWARDASNGDIGDTYVEVSIADQHWWYYKDGALQLESDVVTGDISKGHDTPTGVFRIINKDTEHNMKGSYGTSFCHYWLACTWDGVGIHDAYWRSEFGGEIYKSDGSHGCINTPYDNMQALYNAIDYDTPVVIY